MGTVALRSHDCLKNHLFASRPPPAMNLSRKKPLRSPPEKQPKPTRSRPNQAGPCRRRLGSPDTEDAEARKPIVMGQVTILKRGEELKAKPNSPPAPFAAAAPAGPTDNPSILCLTSRLGPDPKILPRFSDLKAVYAGPAYITSPAPSSLPFPEFFLKKTASKVSEGEIARGLRCLLRLNEI